MKNKVVIFAGGFLPAKEYGGPVVSITNIIASCKNMEFYIVASNKEKNGDKLSVDSNIWINLNGANVYYIDENKTTISEIIKLLQEIKPNTIYLNSFYCYKYIIASNSYYGKQKNVKIIIAPRGQLQKNALKHKSLKKKIYLIIFKIFMNNKYIIWHSTDKIETIAIENLFHNKNQIIEIKNLPVHQSCFKNIDFWYNGHIKFVYLARIHKLKGLLIAIKAIKSSKYFDKIDFDIYGPISDENYWNLCVKEMNGCKNIKYCGLMNHANVGDTLKKYNVYILPTETENYGHSIVEALINGIPVIISDKTPWNSIVDYSAGFIIKNNTLSGYVESIDKLCSLDVVGYKKMLENVNNYATNVIINNEDVEKYENLFK